MTAALQLLMLEPGVLLKAGMAGAVATAAVGATSAEIGAAARSTAGPSTSVAAGDAARKDT